MAGQAGYGVFGLAGWRFMMICVGLPPSCSGVICWFWLTDGPGDATWLTAEQRAWADPDVLDAEERHVGSRFLLPLRRTLTSPRIGRWPSCTSGSPTACTPWRSSRRPSSPVSKKTFGVQLSRIEVGLITAIPTPSPPSRCSSTVAACRPTREHRLARRHPAGPGRAGDPGRAVSASPPSP